MRYTGSNPFAILARYDALIYSIITPLGEKKEFEKEAELYAQHLLTHIRTELAEAGMKDPPIYIGITSLGHTTTDGISSQTVLDAAFSARDKAKENGKHFWIQPIASKETSSNSSHA